MSESLTSTLVRDSFRAKKMEAERAEVRKNMELYPNTGIFANNAPILWQHGLPVIPLRPRKKEPIPLSWQHYSEKMPTPQEQDHWLHNLPDCNIGLPLGAQSGCVAIDIDTEDQNLINIISQICGYSPWERVGKKGKVLLYKFNGEKPFKIKDIDGHMICECLSSRNQVVLPPSIHPDTQAPYKCNIPIVEALPMLRALPANIESLLRNAFQDYGVTLSHSGWTRTTDYVSQGSRDVKMTAMAGLLANGVTRGELPLLEAMDRLRAWKSLCVENVAGDDIDIEKGVRNLIQFLIQDVTGPKNKPLPLGWDTGLTQEQKDSWGLNFDSEHSEWSVQQLQEYLQRDFEKYEEGSVERIGTIDYVLRRISRSPSLSSLEIDNIFTYIRKTNKNSVQMTSLKKRLAELRQGELEGIDHTEIAKAVLVDLQRIGDVKFWNDEFWQYKGSNWEVLQEQEILCLIANNYGNLPAARKAHDHLGIMKVLKAIIPQGELNTKRAIGVNFANCFVTNEGLMLPHDANFGCTYTLPFRYVPELADNHPRFDAFLESIWGMEDDFEERKQAVREAMCATFFGMGPSFARAILLYGIAGSGKSQLLEIVKHLLPPSVISYVTPYKFEDKFEVTELSKSLLNICGELNESQPISGAYFKSIIDGSSLNGQYKGRQVFSFTPTATHWFASNYLPKTKDTSEGFNRRWLILTFNHAVQKKDKIRNIGEIIVAEEREAIAAWVIACVRELSIQKDYTLPRSHRETMRDMASENDSIFFFLTSAAGPRKLETGNSQESVNSIYEKYTSFCCATIRAKPVGLRLFLRRLTELGNFMGFKVDGLVVNGLTMDKGKGVPLISEI